MKDISSPSQAEKKTTGQLLRYFRKRKDVYQHELGEKIGTTHQMVSAWEKDKSHITNSIKRKGDTVTKIDYLLRIKHALGLDPNEYNEFILSRFPAFDPNWLSRQPEKEQAGLLLKACRERSGLTAEELGDAIGAKNTVPAWELGLRPIPDGTSNRDNMVNHIPDIFKAFEEPKSLDISGNLDPDDNWFDDDIKKRIIAAIQISNPLIANEYNAARGQGKLKAKSVTVGAAHKRNPLTDDHIDELFKGDDPMRTPG